MNDYREIDYGIQLIKLQTLASHLHVPLDVIIHDRMDQALASLHTAPVIDHASKIKLRNTQLKRLDNGLRGEELVLAKERKKLAGTPYENAVDPHFALDPSFGFDLLSFTPDGNQLYIEVKTTSDKKNTPFFISASEKAFMEFCHKTGRRYELHRVFDIDRMGVKASQFSFNRLQKADPVLGVDMSSTGEVGCLGDTFEEALLNSLIATGYKIPAKSQGIMLSSGGTKEKASLLDGAQALQKAGYKIYATEGTAKFLGENGVNAIAVGWPDEAHKEIPNVMDMIHDHKFDLIVNIPKDHTKREQTNGYKIRRGAIDHNIPLITNARLASAFIEAFCKLSINDLQIKSWQEY